MADELEQASTSYLTSVLRGTSRKHDGTDDDEEDVEAADEDAAAAADDADAIITHSTLELFKDTTQLRIRSTVSLSLSAASEDTDLTLTDIFEVTCSLVSSAVELLLTKSKRPTQAAAVAKRNERLRRWAMNYYVNAGSDFTGRFGKLILDKIYLVILDFFNSQL